MAATCSAGSRSRWTAASPPPAAPRTGSAARRTSSTPIACARCSTPWWSAPAPCAPMIRSSPRARCEGPSPVRVVLDTDRRLDARYRVFREGPETLLLCAPDAPGEDRVGNAAVLRLPRAGEGLDDRRRARRARRARAAAGVRRGRRHHRVALSRRRRARPAARDHRAAADRLRHSRLHPAGSGDADRRAALRLVGASGRRRPAGRHPAVARTARPAHDRGARVLDHRARARRDSRRDIAAGWRGSGAGAHAGQRRVARHRGAGVRRPRAAEPAPGDACAADGRRVSVSGEIRLQRGRPHRPMGDASSCCIRTRTFSSRPRRCASRCPMPCRRSARCWPPTWRRR